MSSSGELTLVRMPKEHKLRCLLTMFVAVPIATRYPPANVRFEIADANQPLRWDDNTVDLVHIRDMFMAVCKIYT
jgi:hypothetical protein